MNKKRPIHKVLCVCRGGNVRSVALKRIIHRYLGHETLACGLDNNGPEVLAMLYDWADVIVVAHNAFFERIPGEHHRKTLIVHLGADIWANCFHPDLQCRVVDALNLSNALHYGRKLSKIKVMRDFQKYMDKVNARQLDQADPYA